MWSHAAQTAMRWRWTSKIIYWQKSEKEAPTHEKLADDRVYALSAQSAKCVPAGTPWLIGQHI